METVYPWQHAGNTITPFSAESDETHSHHAGPALDALSEIVDCLEHWEECVRVCVGGGGGFNVLVALYTPALYSCMSRHVNILLKFLWNTPHVSLTHQHMCETPSAGVLNNSDTLRTLSHKLHTTSRRSGRLPERLIYQIFLILTPRKKKVSLFSHLYCVNQEEIIIQSEKGNEIFKCRIQKSP